MTAVSVSPPTGTDRSVRIDRDARVPLLRVRYSMNHTFQIVIADFQVTA